MITIMTVEMALMRKAASPAIAANRNIGVAMVGAFGVLCGVMENSIATIEATKLIVIQLVVKVRTIFKFFIACWLPKFRNILQ